MTNLLIAAGLVLAALAVGLVPALRRRPTRRLANLRIVDSALGGAPVGEPAAAGAAARSQVPLPPERSSRLSRLSRLDRRRACALVVGVAIAVTVNSWWGVLAGAGAGVVLDQALRRLPAPGQQARRLAEASDLPLVADLLAVALRGGAPVGQATAAVADAVPGPLGEHLRQVARLLSLGATAAEAWARLAAVPGAGRLIRAAVRSAEHGGALADALSRLASDLRADRAIAVEAAARRAGVLIVLPLGFCFLPAFMLAGLGPVIIAVLGDVL